MAAILYVNVFRILFLERDSNGERPDNVCARAYVSVGTSDCARASVCLCVCLSLCIFVCQAVWCCVAVGGGGGGDGDGDGVVAIVCIIIINVSVQSSLLFLHHHKLHLFFTFYNMCIERV